MTYDLIFDRIVGPNGPRKKGKFLGSGKSRGMALKTVIELEITWRQVTLEVLMKYLQL